MPIYNIDCISPGLYKVALGICMLKGRFNLCSINRFLHVFNRTNNGLLKVY